MPTLEQITQANGIRHYKTPAGKLYPSITTVLSKFDMGWLDDWKSHVGAEEAAKVSSRASNRGRILHKALELYLQNEPIDLKSYMPDIRGMVANTLPVLESINSVLVQETPLYSDAWELAGTPDLIGEYKGVMSVIDFKNSNRIKAIEDIDSYFIQCLAYAIMFEERTGVQINQGVIIMAVEGFPTQVMVKDLQPFLGKLHEAREGYRTTTSQ